MGALPISNPTPKIALSIDPSVRHKIYPHMIYHRNRKDTKLKVILSSCQFASIDLNGVAEFYVNFQMHL